MLQEVHQATVQKRAVSFRTVPRCVRLRRCYTRLRAVSVHKQSAIIGEGGEARRGEARGGGEEGGREEGGRGKGSGARDEDKKQGGVDLIRRQK